MANELISKINLAISLVNDAYNKITLKGGTYTGQHTTSNLSDAIDTIPQGSGTVTPLSANFTVNKNTSIYNASTSEGSGYNPITVNIGVESKKYSRNIDIDSLNISSDYIIADNDSSKYVDEINIKLHTKYPKTLECNKSDLDNFITDYCIPFGYKANGTFLNLSSNDKEAVIFTASCILTSLNPDLYPYITSDVLKGSLAYSYIDFELSNDLVVIINRGSDVCDLTEIQNIVDFDSLCDSIGGQLAKCTLYDVTGTAKGTMGSTTNFNTIYRYRICTSVNLYMCYVNAFSTDSHLFVPRKSLDAASVQQVKKRITSIYSIFSQEKLFTDLKDIVCELPTKLSKKFEPLEYE